MSKIIGRGCILSLLVLGVYAAGCDAASERTGPETEVVLPSAVTVEERLAASPELQRLLEIEADFFRRIADRGITKQQMRGALLTRDEQAVYNLLGYSAAEMSDLSNELESLKAALYSEYQEEIDLYRQQHDMPSSCTAQCREQKAAEFIQHYDAIVAEVASNPSLKPCNSMIGYTACLIACSGAGPVMYWVCAAGCYCGFGCNGGCW